MKKEIIFLVISILFFFTSFDCEHSVEPVGSNVKVVWSYPLPQKAFADLVMPIIENSKAYIASDSTIRCVNLKTGEIIWQTDLGIAGNRLIQSAKLLISGNLLFLNHSSWVKALDKLTGNIVWYTTIENFRSIDLTIMSQNSTSLLIGGQGEVIKVSKSTGNIELRIKLIQLIPGGGGYFQLANNPVISEDGFIYVPTGWFDGIKSHGNILCYNSTSGEFIWGHQGPDNNSGVDCCSIKDSLLVFPSASTMYELNRFTGKKIWETTVPNYGFWWSTTIKDGTVYIGSTGPAKMHAFDLITGKLKWQSEDTGSSIITIITVTNGRVYFCNFAYIYVLNVSDGSVVWKGLPPEYVEDQGYVYSSPVSVGEGYMVCIGSKKVYCLTVP